MQPNDERLNRPDLALMRRTNRRISALQASIDELRELVLEHFGETYALREGDTVEDDGTITRRGH